MTPDRFKELLDRYAQGKCTGAEKELVEEWYNNLESHPASIPKGTEERLWNRIHATTRRKDSFVSAFSLAKIAASVTLIAMISVWLYVDYFKPAANDQVSRSLVPETFLPEEVRREIRNDSDSPQQITLEDGSVITLQPESSLTLPEKFSPSERIVSLTGEAFFDIRRDTLRPFFVYSREVVTKVLGTSFTIKARELDKQITVAVKTGKVSVFTNPQIKRDRPSEVILTPNQEAVYDRKDIVVTKKLVEKPEVILEKPTIFRMKYDETPVSEIFAALENNYGVDIQYDEKLLTNCVLTTTMSDEGLFERIQVICKAIGATYSLDNAVIKIDGNGCR